MEALWSLYHQEMPDFLAELAATPPMERLKRVGMNCGCEYTSFPLFAGMAPSSRYEHSVGVGLIVWHFTGSREQAAAGSFHDVTTPVFAHVVDFLNGDHLRQESTEAGVADCLAASDSVMDLLARYGLALEDVSDYHQYPVADNDAPALSADRLEYTLRNLLHYGFMELDDLRTFYEDLRVGTNERGETELVFQTPELASAFTRAALRTARVYVADEDRFAMQTLADLLGRALARGVLSREELWTTEPEVVAKLTADPVSRGEWERFRAFSVLRRAAERPEEDGWLSVGAKKRWIDPFVVGRGRVSQWDTEVRRELDAFRAMDFSVWLRGGPD